MSEELGEELEPQDPSSGRVRSGMRAAGAAGSAAVLAGGSALGVLAALAGPSGAATFTVTEASDDGTGATPGTLSWAIAQANTDSDPDVIDFSPSLSTITFTGNADQVQITEPLSITGPGSLELLIDFNENCGLSAYLTGALSVSGVRLDSGLADDCDTRGDDNGGALAVYGGYGSSDGSLTITDVTFSNSDALYYGGGLACDGTFAVTITDSTFINNAADENGGGASLKCELDTVISGSAFLYNAGRVGGGFKVEVRSDNSTTVVNSTFRGNSARRQGGGAYFENGNAIVRNSTFEANTAARYGGGIGGDVPMFIYQSTVTGNSAEYAAGGVFAKQGRFLGSAYANLVALDLSTVSGNTAPLGSEIGIEKINAPNDLSTSITGSIVAGPGESAVTGLYNPASIEFAQSIVGAVTDADVTDLGGNFFDETDPGLEALADNGGPTQTMALSEGSPAIDAGPDPVPDFPGNTYDQRGPGFDRVTGGQADIGAFELQQEPEPTTTTSPEPTTTTSPEPTSSTSMPDPATSTTAGGGSESASGGLPATGASVAPLVAAGVALVGSGAGAAALAARRRRGEHGLDDQD